LHPSGASLLSPGARMANEPDIPIPSEDVLTTAARLIGDRRPFALATVIDTRGSTSARNGAKAIFAGDGSIVTGWVGGGCAESTIAHAAIECIESGAPQVVDVDLDDEVLGAGMPCGGAMRVFVEPVLPRPRLWILGHGRVAECLCLLGDLMGFDIVIDDPMAAPARFPAARQVLTDDTLYAALSPAASDFVVVATQHRGDHQSMQRLLASDVRHVALIASRKRTGLVLDYLREQGIDDKRLALVRAPAGLDLGAATPEEIALSVISEIVMVRRGGSGAIRSQAGAGTPQPAPAIKIVRTQ